MNFKKGRSAQQRQTVAPYNYRREVAAVMISALCIFFMLTIVSYNPIDSSFFYYNPDQLAVGNWCGQLGAHAAALLFYFLGSGSYLLVLVFASALVAVLGRQSLWFFVGRLWWTSLLTLEAAVLCALNAFDAMHHVPGGFVGVSCAKVLVHLTGTTGSHVLMWSLVWVTVLMLVKVPLVPSIVAAYTLCAQAIISLSRVLHYGADALLKRMASAKKTEQATDELVIAASALPSDEAFDDDMAPLRQAQGERMDGQGDTQQGERAAFASQFDPTLPGRLASVIARQKTGRVPFLRTMLARLPNTVLPFNMFAEAVTGPAPYLLIIKQLRSIKPLSFKLPEANLFRPAAPKEASDQQHEGEKRGRKVEEKLQHFGIKGTIAAIKPGPVVTLFEYKPEIDSKISKIIALEDDLAMALTAHSLRIIAPIPGKNAVGFEIANAQRDDVVFSELLTHKAFAQSAAKLPVILGVDAVGSPVVEDLATAPHLLVGGSTGSGKSVGLNVMLVSLLCKLTPDELKLILIDPKRLEFTPYADIPHLLFPIVTQPQKASSVLAWVVHDMEERYSAMARFGVRNVQEYRRAAAEKMKNLQEGEEAPREMPYLVVIIDELADLMMVAGKEVETYIVRIAQMARAAGIHMIVATQRPSVDVVTGLIKVNFPTRVAFRVSSKIDSRTILDNPGAEKLLGRGDMLYMHASSPEVRRVHCPYVSDEEVQGVADFLRAQRRAQYITFNDALIKTAGQPQEYEDELYSQIREFVQTQDEISISMLQRHYRIGFNRSARLIEKLETEGFLAPAQGSKPRKVIR